MDEATLTVTDVNRAARHALQEAFAGPIWVRGEVQRLVRSKPGHVYFDLVDKDDLRDRVRSRVRVALFRDDRPTVERKLREAGLELSDDVEIRLAARVGFYVERGEFQLVMHGVDPSFTVGRLAAERARLLRRLAGEGLLEANARHVLSRVPLRIALVSSGGTAAYHDFVHELEVSGLAWRVVHTDVRVQGNVAPRRLAKAVREISVTDVDAIVLVRGGGARTDLAPFDAEPLARAIATAPVPVVTGIGHETDRTVADEVAHTACKTPTACARFLVERVLAFVARIDALGLACARAARVRVDDEHRRQEAATRRVSRGARAVCLLAQRELISAARRAGRSGPMALDRERRRLGDRSHRVARAAPRRLDGARHDIEQFGSRLRALDPRRVLERGYSVTRDTRGDVVRAAADLAPGDVLVTEFPDGTVRSRVEDTG